MADQRQARGASERESRTKEPEPALSAAEAGQYGLRQVAELTGKDPETITGVEPADDDGWLITVEVVEDRRIPSATDVLASYEAEIGPDGELVSYRRLRRYSRGRGDDRTA
jgi:Gas vesicle synthesis protein GvpO